jgi:hypothetical protein
LEAVLVFIVATAAMLIFTAGLQGFFIAKSRIYESLILILIAFTLFRPGFWMDMVAPPTESVAPTTIAEQMAAHEPGTELRLQIDGLDAVGDPTSFTTVIEVPEGETGADRIANFGLELIVSEADVVIDNVTFDSPAEKQGVFDWDQKIVVLEIPAEQPPRELMWIPALMLLGLIWVIQSRRRAALA